MKYLLILLLCFTGLSSSAQSLIDSLGNPGFTMQDTIGDKLAELAINNALIKVDDAEVLQKDFEIKKNRAAWLNNIGASFNLNEANLKSQPSNQQNVFFPRYNFNLTIPLGYFFTKSRDVQIAKAAHEKAQATREMDIENIKQAIKTQYQLYQANKYLLALHETVLQDERVLLSRVETRFKEGEAGVTLENLTDASKRYNAELVKKVNLLTEVNNSKVILENMIGMKLEDALKKISEQE